MGFMSLEQQLYNFFYDTFGELDSKVVSLIEKGEKIETEELERNRRKYEKLFTAIKYVTGGLSLYLGADVINDFISNDAPVYHLFLDSTLAAANGFLSIHFNYATKLYRTLNDKIFKKKVLPKIKEINKWGKRGRYSHLAGVISFGVYFAPMAYSFAESRPVIGGILLGIAGYAAYHNLLKGYSAIYKAGDDFIIGERRFQPEPTPPK